MDGAEAEGDRERGGLDRQQKGAGNVCYCRCCCCSCKESEAAVEGARLDKRQPGERRQEAGKPRRRERRGFGCC